MNEAYWTEKKSRWKGREADITLAQFLTNWGTSAKPIWELNTFHFAIFMNNFEDDEVIETECEMKIGKAGEWDIFG